MRQKKIQNDLRMAEDRIRELEAALAETNAALLETKSALSGAKCKNESLEMQLNEHTRRMDRLETQTALALAQKDSEMQRVTEAGSERESDLKTKLLEVELERHKLEVERHKLEVERSKSEVKSTKVTLDALALKNKLVHKELKECKQKMKLAAGGAAEEEEDDDDGVKERMTDAEHAEDIGQRKHARLSSSGRLYMVMWKAPKQMHAAQFNELGAFVKAVSCTVVELDDDDDEEERFFASKRRKRRAPVNKEWLGILELEAPMPFKEVERRLKALGQNDIVVGPVYLESEQQVLVRPKGGATPQTWRMQIKLSFLRKINVDDNFMRQSKRLMYDYIIAHKDRQASCEDVWICLTRVME